jgi:hypothetical protein
MRLQVAVARSGVVSSASLARHSSASGPLSWLSGIRFYNRGIPDGYGWDRFFGLEPYAELEDATRLYRYDTILVLDPLDTLEDENDVVWAKDREIRRVHELIVQGYYDAGYSPVFVPADDPGARLDFICANLRIPRPAPQEGL